MIAPEGLTIELARGKFGNVEVLGRLRLGPAQAGAGEGVSFSGPSTEALLRVQERTARVAMVAATAGTEFRLPIEGLTVNFDIRAFQLQLEDETIDLTAVKLTGAVTASWGPEDANPVEGFMPPLAEFLRRGRTVGLSAQVTIKLSANDATQLRHYRRSLNRFESSMRELSRVDDALRERRGKVARVRDQIQRARLAVRDANARADQFWRQIQQTPHVD
jgi:hypothetical protein